MGNAIITKRIKGITNYYAASNISKFRKGEFLKIVPEFDNPYDKNALAIYDLNCHKLGFIDKYSNVLVYQKIKDNDYICIITHVYESELSPSIEFEIIYRTSGIGEEISSFKFNSLLEEYNEKVFNHSNKNHKKEYANKEKINVNLRDVLSKEYKKNFELELVDVDCEHNAGIMSSIEVEQSPTIYYSEIFYDNQFKFFLRSPYYKNVNNSNDIVFVDYMKNMLLPKIKNIINDDKIYIDAFENKINICLMLNGNETLSEFKKKLEKFIKIEDLL